MYQISYTYVTTLKIFAKNNHQSVVVPVSGGYFIPS